MHRHSGKTARIDEVNQLLRVARLGFLPFCICLALSSLSIPGSASRTSKFSVLAAANGKIAFESRRDGRTQIYVMDADGSSQTNISNDNNDESQPAWSPDGTKIVYVNTPSGSSLGEIWVMNADGSGKAMLFASSEAANDPDWASDGSRIAFTLGGAGGVGGRIVVMQANGTNLVVLDPTSASDIAPSWSADSTKIAFETVVLGQPDEIWVMNADGTNVAKIATGSRPAWSPDGTKITFTRGSPSPDIYVMNADGSGQIQLTTDPAFDAFSTWSPDGMKIAFTSNRGGNFEVFVMNADGSNQVNLSNSPATDGRPKWQRIPQGSASVQFSSGNYSSSEGSAAATITTTRIGDTSGTATVDYAITSSIAYMSCTTISGVAAQNCDYTIASGALSFGAGETNKDFVVLIADDLYVEGNETLSLGLSSPTGATLGNPSTATLTILDNDSGAPAFNPADNAQFFVRQHYYDFLSRLPDDGGLAYWSDQILRCGSDATCVDSRRVGVSAAFFIELEFQQTGYVVYRLYRAAYGTLPGASSRANLLYSDFMLDRNQLIAGPQLQQSTIDLANRFVERATFKQVYADSMTQTDFVNKLFDTAGVNNPTERQQAIQALNNGTKTRAQVLLDLIEISEFKTREFNPAFVLMQYFGYLRRDADQGGYDFWLDILNNREPNNFRGMVCAFITSREYQERFSSVVTRNDQLCANID